MNVLLFAESGAERQLLTNALERVGFEPTHPVDVWDQVLAQVATARPDLAVISYATLAAAGGDAVQTAALTLRAIGLPVIVSLDAVYSVAAEDIAAQTGFEAFVATPFESNELAAAITRVTGREVFPRRQTDVTSDFAAVAEEYAQAGVVLSESGDHVALVGDVEESAPEFRAPQFGARTPSEPMAATLSEVVHGVREEGARVQAAPMPPPIDNGATEEIQIVDDPFADMDDDGDDVDPFAEALAWSGASQARRASSGSPRVTMSSPATPRVERSEDEGSGASGVTGRRVFVSDPSGENRAFDSGASGASERVAIAPPPPEELEGSPAAVFSAVGGEPEPQPGDSLRVIELPLPGDVGAIGAPSVAALLHGLCVRRATGELVLQNESLTRRVVLYDGEFGTVFTPPTAEDERKLLSTVGWTGGQYEFTEADVPEAQFHSFGEPLELLFRGVERHIGINELAVALQDKLKLYPRRTDQIDRLSRVLGLEEVQAFSETSTGTQMLEQRLATAGAQTESVLRFAYFAVLIGTIVFDERPGEGVVRLSFANAPAAPASSRSRIRATASAPPLLASSGPTPSIQVPESARAPRRPAGTADSGEHRQTFDRLGQLWTQISSQDAYEVFELEPGCGADAVNKRFYEMVREYHPDRYARVDSAQIKTLAEKIFLHIRSLHADLTQREQTGDYSRRSTGTFKAGLRPGGDADSDLSARERRARRRSAASRMAATSSGAQAAVRPTTGQRPMRPSSDPATTSNAYGATGQSRAVGESINRLRSRSDAATASSPTVTASNPTIGTDGGFTRGASGSHNTIASARRLAPDQLLRNAKKSVENGAEDKAWDLLELARIKGLKGHEADAYEVYLQARRGEVANDAAMSRLDGIASNAEAHRLERSQSSMLAGHLLRLDEKWSASAAKYDAALEQDPDNGEATRWARYVKKKAESEKPAKKGGTGFLDRLRASFTKK